MKLSMIACTLCLMVTAGCTSHDPFLYPNEHLQQVGWEQARADIEECRVLARRYTPHDEQRSRTLGGTGSGASHGATIGAVSGIPVVGALVGGAAGGLTGFVKSQPERLDRQFIAHCLRTKGYDTVGPGVLG